jgi:uncharacterized protein (DUF362 family)/Pyruvate/2-oxoacid:ferredoxin oxidoreductase delta subunit
MSEIPVAAPRYPGPFDAAVCCYPQKEYGVARVQRALQEMAGQLPGAWSWIRPGDRILIKPNLLRPSPSEEAIVTHPDVIEATVRMLLDLRAEPIIAESPGGPHTFRMLERLYHRCGLKEVAERTGVVLNRDTATVAISHPSGRLVKHFELIRPCAEADGLINLPKAKTHSFMLLTGAVKNLFGLIPGLKKPGYHATLRRPAPFAEMLLDLLDLIGPRLTIMDGIVGMEGDGPSAGRPRRLGFLLMGRSALYVDHAFSRLVGVDPREVPVLAGALERGWLRPSESIRFTGPDAWQGAGILDFQLPATLHLRVGLGALPFPDVCARLLANACSLRPHVPPQDCEGCGVCLQNCPVGAISMSAGHAEIDHSRCIHCYCCHELCPEKIVELKGSWLYKLLRPFSGHQAPLH